ncbi:MAG: PocR ligand-binding domain-containing protein [bacterium]
MANKSFTILVIDDHADNLIAIRAFLVDAFSNMTVLTAPTGEEGIALARQHHPSLILLDILMPNMDGYEVCRRMKQDPAILHIPVVFLTAQKDNREVRIKAIESGAEGFLSKPFDEKELIALVRAMLRLSEANEQAHDEKLFLAKLVAKRTRQLEDELAERKRVELSLQEANLELQKSKASILNVLEDFSAQRDSEKKMVEVLRVNEEKYRTLFSEMLEGFAVHEIICDDAGVPIDYRFLSVNPAFERITGKKAEDTVGHRASEFMRETDQVWIDIYGKVALTRQPIQFEQHATFLNKWFEVSAFSPALNQFACVFQDITERKRLQDAVEKRIVALTCPVSKGHEIAFEELFDLKEIQRIQDEFASAAGVASLITFVDGTPITHPSNFTRFCRDFIRLSEKGCENCRQSDAELGRLYPEGPMVSPCLSGGLWHAAVNIIVGGRHIANWLIGQVRDGTQTEENVLGYARELGFNEQAFLQAFHEVPVMPQEQFNKIAKALFTLANQLSTQAYMNIQQARLIADEKRYIKELRQLSAAIEQSSEEIVITDATGIIQYVNPAFVKITGYTQKEALGQNPRFLQGNQQESAFYKELWRTISAGRTWSGRFINKRKDGVLFTEDAAISPVCDSEGKIVNYVAVKRDVSEHLRLADELQQAQKMESIGRLAGGVAHDFNNMLQVIIGTSELAMEELDPSTSSYANFKEIYKVGRRSADLTQQLLAFARRQTIVPVVFDLNQAIAGILKMLRRLINESIQINFRPQENLGDVKMDPSQLDQILTNLCLNARDATPGAGEILIETGCAILDEDFCVPHHDLEPGEYLHLKVSDHGVGMDKEMLTHVFEPFFTTKGFGRGTGLGLSMVYGIVKQNKGHIEVQSVLGQGTTFDLYLPKKSYAVPMIGEENKEVVLSSGAEVILLTEDEASVLMMCQRCLEESGYTVLGAETPEKALSIAKDYPGEIHLLLSDIVMPNMSGIELQKQVIVSRPSMRTLFMTGYTTHDFRRDTAGGDRQVLLKPFLIKDLLSAVRKALDSH